MARFRLYVEDSLCLHKTYFLDQSQAHYVSHVLRLKTGDDINVFHAEYGEFEATLEVLKKQVSFTPLKQVKTAFKPSKRICLLFPPLKHGPLEMLIQKGTELGVTDFYPMITKHTAIHKMNHGRLTSIAIEAAEQCGRLDIPSLHPLKQMMDIFAHWDSHEKIYVCDERLKGEDDLLLGKVFKPSKTTAFLIGPEGGFHEDERKAMQTLSFIQKVALGETILKAETAAITCLSYRLLIGEFV